MLDSMNDKDADIVKIADVALNDEPLLLAILDGLKVKKETLRYNCSKVLLLISELHGEVLYPRWDYFEGFLDSANTYHKLSALLILANLTAVDNEKRFEKILDKYYALLDDKSIITTCYIARASGRIVRAKPWLEAEITGKLLDIDKTHHEAERKDLAKGQAIEAFAEYFTTAQDKERIIAFTREQQTSLSPKTRKIAKKYLEEWELT